MNSKSFKNFVLFLYFCYTSISGQSSTEPSLFPHSNNFLNSSELYCLGGRNENAVISFSVSKLNPTNNQWEGVPGMSTPKILFGASVIGKKIYVCGGYTGYKELNLLEVFDCEDNTWSELSPMPHERDEFGMTALNGNIYVAGGEDNSNKSISSVLKYSPQSNTWGNVKAMGRARKTHELVTLDNAIYAIGGDDTNTVERYSPLIDEWNFVPSTKYSHSSFGATSHKKKIYVLSEKGFEEFDPQSETWKELPSPQIGYGTQLVSINDELWAVGGREGNNNAKASKAVFEFNITSNSWHQLSDMDVTRKNHRAVVVNL